jgi:hypothetical protein
VNWTFTSREDVNYTYGLTDRNLSYLAHHALNRLRAEI